MNDAVVLAKHMAVEIDDLARTGSTRPQPLDDLRIMPARHEADILAVLLVGHRQTETARQFPRLGLGAIAERKAQELELRARGAKKKIALVALRLACAIERPAAA